MVSFQSSVHGKIKEQPLREQSREHSFPNNGMGEKRMRNTQAIQQNPQREGKKRHREKKA